ncbi:hypothetical protein ONZ43_g2534 [Nemania bipapillata]|uniref:Uncharacterized protein n=1 Tax=Nemania bipapillata TaxID=110536 RepID=A0ACC2J097_9PEZI|nr:hypothetical protein ONZ43_g2534 [Nemania bipapillata]
MKDVQAQKDKFEKESSRIEVGALKVLLKAHVAECKRLAALLEYVEHVLSLVRYGAIYETVYLGDVSDAPTKLLRRDLIDLYGKILILLAHVKQDLDSSRVKRDWRMAIKASGVQRLGILKLIVNSVADRGNGHRDTDGDEQTDEGFAFFYYSKIDQELRGNPEAHILGSFLRQLARVSHYPKRIYTSLVKLYNSMKDQGMTFNGKLYQENLVQLVNLFPRTFLVLDGLDEMADNYIENIVEFLIELVKKSERVVKVFISSRQTPTITKLFLYHNPIKINVSYRNQPDIRKFVHKFVYETKNDDWDSDLKREVEKTLCEKASGMFKLAYLQTKRLAKVYSPEATRSQLKGLPKGLEEAYDEMCNIQDEDREYLKRAVEWVAYARQPLVTKFLLPVLQIGLESEDDEPCLSIKPSQLPDPALERICSELIRKDPDGVWRFPHASVEEYFRNKKPEPWISDKVPVKLAKLSVLLLTKIFRDLPLPESDEEAKYMAVKDIDCSRDQDPLISLRGYMARYWVWHIVTIRDCVDQRTIMSELLKRFMLAKDNPSETSSAYKAWARYTCQTHYEWTWSFRRDFMPADNPAFGIAALGLYSTTTSWGEECLKRSLKELNDRGLDLLSIAAWYGDLELCDKLAEFGTDMNRVLPSGSSALIEALKGNNVDCVKMLIKHGAKADIETSSRPLCSAASSRCNEEILNILLKHGAKPDDVCANCSRSTALQAAAAANELRIAKWLVEAGATVDKCTGGLYGNALAAAAYRGSQEVADFLIEQGADVNIDLEDSKYGCPLAAAFLGSKNPILSAGDWHDMDKSGLYSKPPSRKWEAIYGLVDAEREKREDLEDLEDLKRRFLKYKNRS